MAVYCLTTQQMVEGLRAVADFFEANPVDIGTHWAVGVDAYTLTAGQMAEIARTPGGWTWEGGELHRLSRIFGPVNVGAHVERSLDTNQAPAA